MYQYQETDMLFHPSSIQMQIKVQLEIDNILQGKK